MEEEQISVKVSILDREYQLSCREPEREALLQAAEYISDKMREIRSRGKFIGTDRLAIVTALNVAHELLKLRQEVRDNSALHQQIDNLQERIDQSMKNESNA